MRRGDLQSSQRYLRLRIVLIAELAMVHHAGRCRAGLERSRAGGVENQQIVQIVPLPAAGDRKIVGRGLVQFGYQYQGVRIRSYDYSGIVPTYVVGIRASDVAGNVATPAAVGPAGAVLRSGL